jgi:hypothetical protein
MELHAAIAVVQIVAHLQDAVELDPYKVFFRSSCGTDVRCYPGQPTSLKINNNSP